MVDFECGELNWTEINQESKKKFHKLGKLGNSKSGEGIAKFGFLILPTLSIPSIKQQHLLDEKINKKKKFTCQGERTLN